MPGLVTEVPSLKIEKSFSYRGGTKVWSNRYFFNNNASPSDAQFLALANAVTAAEKAIYSNVVTITGAIGYHAGSEVPVWSHTYALTGTWTPGANDRRMPGDVAVLTRFPTTQRSTKNHPIYLYKWTHGVYNNSADPADTLSGAQYTLIQAYFSAWVAGFSDGANTCHMAGPRGAVAQSAGTYGTLRHRDFPA